MERSMRVVLPVLALAGMLLVTASASAQPCAATDIGGRTTCDNPGAACSPPNGGSCTQLAIGCRCRGALTNNQQKCQRAIGQAYVKFACLTMKVEEKCDDAVDKDAACDLTKAQGKIGLESQKAADKVQQACNGVDLSALSPGGCVAPNGTPGTLTDVINCLQASHLEGAGTLMQNQYGGAQLIRCCVDRVCTKTNPANCVGVGTNLGPGACNPNPC